MLDNVPGARAQAERGELAFGTVDSFLIWRLTNGKSHATDATNASRTLLLNIHSGQWDDDLLKLFDVPALDAAGSAAIARGISAMTAARAFRHAAANRGRRRRPAGGVDRPGVLPAGHGQIDLSAPAAFILLNTGAEAVASKHRSLTTIAYQWSGERTYALEGSIFSAGATVQWLRDGLGIIAEAQRDRAARAAADPDQRIYFVPAFTGLGAPHWNSEARGAITGPHARRDAQGDRARRARKRRLSDARPHRRDAGRRRRRIGKARNPSFASTAA